MSRRLCASLASVLLWLWAGPVAGLTPHQEARALLDRWLEAQNEGRFDEYQMYYGDEFTGVRRSENRTARFDRAGWLQDRKRMFEKPMTVAAEDVHIYASAQTARVVFTQRWSSGRYADTGPKQLILRHGLDGFHIAREELFASDRRTPGTVDLEAFHHFTFVVDGEVVVTMQTDDSWGVGEPIVEKPGADPLLQRWRRAVDRAKLPAGIAALAGTTVRLMDARGLRCEAKLGDLLLRGRVFEGLAGEGGSADAAEPSREAAQELWRVSPHYLVARVIGDQRACAGASWARVAALPLPAIATAAPPPHELTVRAIAAFQALPGSAKIQRQFAQWYARAHPESRRRAPLWFQRPRQKPVVRIFRPAGRPALLSVSARIDEGGCENGVFGGVWALWEVDDRDPTHPRLILRNQPDPEMTLQPTAAVDVDGDGTPELLFDGSSSYASVNAAGQPDFLEHGIVRLVDGAYLQIVGPQTPIYVCPC